ncbi:C40 family peptidase [Paenibacillus doosanensis]|uniref:C40 family peptidase n=1 Tax=Paenibacillus doosanensis TaxID=1229154 RepID=UPI00217FCAE6|nr:SH3 domain-containing C40 family peptidase [Paenibacillus doosanensis]MCS7459047.1 C40 family peptidase [Paenibacillus doosanensis]
MKKQLAALLLATTLTAGIGLVAPHEAHAASAQIVSGVNFRDAPSTSSKVIRMLKKGESVNIVSKVNNYWYQVRDANGKVGYVSTDSKYIKSSSSGNSSSGNSGNSGSGSSNNNTSTNTSATVTKIINAGKKYLGTPYEFGSSRSNTKTFDCSDFVRQAFKDGAGITLPSDSRQQADYVKKLGNTTTDWHNLKPGDLMFFMDYKGTSKSAYPTNKSNQRISHVAIYLGNGQVLHTYSKESGGVRIDSIEGKHWEYRFVFGGSALK